MGRWGWPIMGLLAAAPVLAHALDWRKRTEVKKRREDERRQQQREELQRLHGIIPTGDDVYKAAAYCRALHHSKEASVVEKLDLLDAVIRSREQDGHSR